MEKKPVFPLTVFYDGSCGICAAEMQHYREKNPGGRLVFVDISDPSFEPKRYGRTRQEFMAQMHAMDAEGSLFRGVDAFAAIWAAFPDPLYRFLGGVIRLPVMHLLARLGYSLFARFRRYLPRTAPRCDSTSCHPGHRR